MDDVEDNVICKVCLRENIDLKEMSHFSEEKFEVIAKSASVQAQTGVDKSEQKCLKLNETKIKMEFSDIHIEETKICIPKFEKAYIKQEFEDNLSVTSTNKSFGVKVECDGNISPQDPLYVDANDINHNLINLKTEKIANEDKRQLFQCSTCSQQFQSKHLLVHHMELHNEVKPFKCDICSTEFTRLYNLKMHLLLHTGEKPYKCDICSKVFNNAGNLKQHQYTHTPDKPFKCEACNKQFARGNQLKIHMRMHGAQKPYKCSVCPEAFSASRNLKIHQLTHTGGQPYECEVCSKHFYSSGELKLHQMSHTGETL